MVDLHTHSNFSDGTESPEEVAERARGEGVGVLALTDHDNVSGAGRLRGTRGIKVVAGVELSSRTAAGKCHILGLGIDPLAPKMAALLEKASALRREKLEARIAFLAAGGYALPAEELEALRRLPGAGKPHLGELLVKHGYAGSLSGAIRGILDGCKTPNDRLEARDAVEAVTASGGVAVWAHPFGETGKRELGEEELFTLLRELRDAGIGGLECWYSAYSPERCLFLERLARERGLYVSAGSDYHGARKTCRLGQLNRDNLPVEDGRITVLEAL